MEVNGYTHLLILSAKLVFPFLGVEASLGANLHCGVLPLADANV